MTTFIGVDPGTVTGLARWSAGQPIDTIEWLQVPSVSFAPALRSFIKDDAVVGCERFVIGTNTAKKTRTTTPEDVGRVQEVCAALSVPCFLQTASDAKTFSHDRTMKRLGWYFKGYRHATDAARHLLLLVARQETKTFEKIIIEMEERG